MKDASKLTREERREAMPETARVVDEWMREFALSEIYATENGHEFRWKSRSAGE